MSPRRGRKKMSEPNETLGLQSHVSQPALAGSLKFILDVSQGCALRAPPRAIICHLLCGFLDWFGPA